MLTALAAYGGLELLDLLYYPSDRIASAVLRAIFIFVAVSALISSVLAPREPDHRLVPLSRPGRPPRLPSAAGHHRGLCRRSGADAPSAARSICRCR